LTTISVITFENKSKFTIIVVFLQIRNFSCCKLVFFSLMLKVGLMTSVILGFTFEINFYTQVSDVLISTLNFSKR